MYSVEYARNGFQGGLQSYRVGTDSRDQPNRGCSRADDRRASEFIAGFRDWGTYQRPGRLEAMQTNGCTDWRGVHLVAGAGTWVQQEQRPGWRRWSPSS